MIEEQDDTVELTSAAVTESPTVQQEPLSEMVVDLMSEVAGKPPNPSYSSKEGSKKVRRKAMV